jgi:hypothetical protein
VRHIARLDLICRPMIPIANEEEDFFTVIGLSRFWCGIIDRLVDDKAAEKTIRSLEF